MPVTHTYIYTADTHTGVIHSHMACMLEMTTTTQCQAFLPRIVSYFVCSRTLFVLIIIIIIVQSRSFKVLILYHYSVYTHTNSPCVHTSERELNLSYGDRQ